MEQVRVCAKVSRDIIERGNGTKLSETSHERDAEEGFSNT
jgi:hypothetical protein